MLHMPPSVHAKAAAAPRKSSALSSSSSSAVASTNHAGARAALAAAAATPPPAAPSRDAPSGAMTAQRAPAGLPTYCPIPGVCATPAGTRRTLQAATTPSRSCCAPRVATGGWRAMRMQYVLSRHGCILLRLTELFGSKDTWSPAFVHVLRYTDGHDGASCRGWTLTATALHGAFVIVTMQAPRIGIHAAAEAPPETATTQNTRRTISKTDTKAPAERRCAQQHACTQAWHIRNMLATACEMEHHSLCA